MSHTQPSPTATVAQHHAHMAAQHAVNGHMPAMPAQGQKAVSLSTAQKITALNEQVWLQIGMLLLGTPYVSFPTNRPNRKLDRVDGRFGRFNERL